MKLIDIIIDASIQPRERMDQTVIDEYAARMAAGDTFPPVVVVGFGDVVYLADGFHRYYAARDAGLEEIAAETIAGTVADARWYCVAANKSHGVRRTNGDKRRAAEIALRHENASTLSNRALADHIGVSEGLIRTVRESLERVEAIPAHAGVVVGRDGVERNVEVQRTNTSDAAPSTSSETSREIRDHHGVVVPERIKDTWQRGERAAEMIITNLRNVRQEVMRLFRSEVRDGITISTACTDPVFASLPSQAWSADMKNAIDAITRSVMPYAVCPYCQGTGCDACADRGWVTKSQYATVPSELRTS